MLLRTVLCLFLLIGFIAADTDTSLNVVPNNSSHLITLSNLSHPISNDVNVDKLNAEKQKDLKESTVKLDVEQSEPIKVEILPEEASTPENFKYYFIILTVSSLSVISIIIFKTLRLRKSRAELKYGKANVSDKSEVEPLGGSRSKWLEEDSDENEDEIFDINFLKNARTSNAV